MEAKHMFDLSQESQNKIFFIVYQ